MKTIENTDIKKSYLFRGLNEEEIVELTRIAELETLNPGDTLFFSGEQAKNLYLVHYGSVKLAATGPAHESEVSIVIGSGGTIGEAELVSDLPKISQATAIERTEVVRLSCSKLKNFLNLHPTAAGKVYQALAEHLAYQITHLAKELVRAREVRHLEKHGLTTL